MFEYFSSFAQYINIFAIIWGGVKIALLSFIIALVLLLIFRKKVLVRRRYQALKYLARSYYFFIPIICLCFGFIYGSLTTSRDQVIERLPLYQASIQSFVEQNFDTDLSIDIDMTVYSDQNLDQVLDNVIINASYLMIENASQESQDKNQQFIFMVLKSSVGKNVVKSLLKDKVASTLGVDKEIVNGIFTVPLSDMFTSKMVTQVIAYYVKQTTGSMLTPFMIMWVILLLIPSIEIILANRYDKKYRELVRQP